ncbi:hypothetical protein M8A51_04470 [Schlegelella sp. S2-27]|uniref:Uncharacterized protein n=1 Tax=Caldimonas mangrovi TaxID=2944811 RepID=A0ABT0YJ82_9BURK|nr:hypothetical protein [Caldimonas mangrovi]MCM5678785.1 hypothetical protein [Caldimonas mangrovi]
MKSLTQALRAGWITGGVASLVSTLVLAWRGHLDNRGGVGALNAPSHWVWGDEALRQDRGSLRYTGTGLLVHHLASVFWALLYERLCPGERPRATVRLACHAAAVASVAACVDLRVAPARFTPGFEHRLSSRSLMLVYVAFAAGIVLGGRWADRRAC